MIPRSILAFFNSFDVRSFLFTVGYACLWYAQKRLFSCKGSRRAEVDIILAWYEANMCFKNDSLRMLYLQCIPYTPKGLTTGLT